ncbi:MAG: hypothetical protein JWQ54_1104 [Mucilaginibacter sp.]|nr:hypothetical protein [Mucilaginibacter sp.]
MNITGEEQAAQGAARAINIDPNAGNVERVKSKLSY